MSLRRISGAFGSSRKSSEAPGGSPEVPGDVRCFTLFFLCRFFDVRPLPREASLMAPEPGAVEAGRDCLGGVCLRATRSPTRDGDLLAILLLLCLRPSQAVTASQTSQEAPKIAPRRPKRPPGGSQDGPRGPQYGPRDALDGPRGPQGSSSKLCVSTPGLPCFNARLPWIALSGSPPRLACAKHAEVGIALCDSTLY